MVKVRILGIAGSPRHGNTEIIVKEALNAAEELGDVETELIAIADKKILGGCPSTVCYKCITNPSAELLCQYYEDDVNDIFRSMMISDGIIIGTPVYFGSIPAQLKCVIDRSIPGVASGFQFRNKVAGVITVSLDRNTCEGAMINLWRWFLTHDMIIVGVGPVRPEKGVGSYYGATALQGYPYPVSTLSREGSSAVKQDEVGMAAARFLAKRVTEMAKIVKSGLSQLQPEELAWYKQYALDWYEKYKQYGKRNTSP